MRSKEKTELDTLYRRNILLSEDNTTNQRIMKFMLEEKGINLDIVNNGQEAVNAFKKKKYELILMDIHMPIMDGLEASQHIRTINKEIPIIALTASTLGKDIENTKLAGMNEYLQKPIYAEKLFTTILKYIDKKTNSNHVDILKPPSTFSQVNTLDTHLQLNSFNGNKSLYIQCLKDFIETYEEINLKSLSHKQYNKTVYTLQRLNEKLGINTLNNTAYKLHYNVDKSVTEAFYTQLHLVVREIKNVIEEYA